MNHNAYHMHAAKWISRTRFRKTTSPMAPIRGLRALFRSRRATTAPLRPPSRHCCGAQDLRSQAPRPARRPQSITASSLPTRNSLILNSK